jgi:beta-glucosidase
MLDIVSDVCLTPFQGFVISDYEGIDRLTTPQHADYVLSVKLGILAGIDMV